MFKLLMILLCFAVACSPTQVETRPADEDQPSKTSDADKDSRVAKLLAREVPQVGTKSKSDDAHYKETLTSGEYDVLRKQGTEVAFTGEYDGSKTPGVFHCRACNAPLFVSTTKFDSGTGWPSFYAPIQDRVSDVPDNKWGMRRTEVVCSHCGSHLGHVFADGPEPTNLRYCVNSASLLLAEGEEQSQYKLDVD